LREQVYALVDEVFMAGEIMETSKQKVVERMMMLDRLE
jgi:hypothetical protein